MTRTEELSYATRFAADGVVCCRGLLDRSGLEYAESAYQWSLEHPGPFASEVLRGVPGSFYQDHAHPDAFPHYRSLIIDSRLAQQVAQILGSQNLWLLYEQIWLKEAGDRLPTPWHQDLPYLPLEGKQIATIWINLDPVQQADSLEFVRGSQRGPLYNPTTFDAKDRAAQMYEAGVWPALPDIESERTRWDIVSWGIEPSDVLIFHPAVLHGGAGTKRGTRRRSISLRVIGDESYVAARPDSGLANGDRQADDRHDLDPFQMLAGEEPGTLFRHAAFPKIV
ncbi:phytanoyl-CoA dioxygenase family protein [Gimesia chilikensis]|uniref:phytanoyl-CoA dioxygenase family protein n=1 Tax=Gimesia chilikensis TaxID=2605989 RepID=UPI001189D558|nr:phytanoyl-CoA dioxygenase family protein [Gimesia chilikensis]QDT85311.1 Phytanoyl-CoA dioxygenase (PhyH) [Gimesia chilikensis]